MSPIFVIFQLIFVGQGTHKNIFTQTFYYIIHFNFVATLYMLFFIPIYLQYVHSNTAILVFIHRYHIYPKRSADVYFL